MACGRRSEAPDPDEERQENQREHIGIRFQGRSGSARFLLEGKSNWKSADWKRRAAAVADKNGHLSGLAFSPAAANSRLFQLAIQLP
jgi:hypothetical protein